jgi:hypothetical protein
MISTYSKHFSRTIKTQIRQILKEKNPNRQFFNDKFQQGNQEYRKKDYAVFNSYFNI